MTADRGESATSRFHELVTAGTRLNQMEAVAASVGRRCCVDLVREHLDA